MGDLVPQEGRAMMGTTFSLLLDQKAWSVDPLGHSAYQLKHFVIQQGNPTPDTQYKQCLRELWARWGAYRQAVFTWEQNQARLVELEGWMRLWQRLRWVPFIGLIATGRYGRAKAEHTMLADSSVELQMNMKHCILRETQVLLGILRSLNHSPAEDRDAAEVENWMKRGEQKRAEGAK